MVIDLSGTQDHLITRLPQHRGIPEMSFGMAAFMPDRADPDSPRLGRAL